MCFFFSYINRSQVPSERRPEPLQDVRIIKTVRSGQILHEQMGRRIFPAPAESPAARFKPSSLRPLVLFGIVWERGGKNWVKEQSWDLTSALRTRAYDDTSPSSKWPIFSQLGPEASLLWAFMVLSEVRCCLRQGGGPQDAKKRNTQFQPKMESVVNSATSKEMLEGWEILCHSFN